MILVRLLLVGRTIQNNSHAALWKSFLLFVLFVRLRAIKVNKSKNTNRRTTKRHLIDWTKGIFDIASEWVYAGILSIQKWPDHQLIASNAVRARGIKPFQFLINCFSVLPHHFVCAARNNDTQNQLGWRVWVRLQCFTEYQPQCTHWLFVYSGHCGVH